MANGISSVRGSVGWNWSGAGLDDLVAGEGNGAWARKVTFYARRTAEADKPDILPTL